MNNEKGFTLAEIIVVLAILASLATLAIPNYINYQYRSNIQIDFSTSMEIIRAARTYVILNDVKSESVKIEDIIEGGFITVKEDGQKEIIPLTAADEFKLMSKDNKFIVIFRTDASKVGKNYGGFEYTITEGEGMPEVQRK